MVKKDDGKRESVTYQEMLSEVDGIVREIQAPELDLDLMVGRIEKGYGLIKAMRERLDQTKEKIEKLRLDFE